MATTETRKTETQNSENTRKFEEQRFEFVLFINDHIICQRFFDIRNFNEDSVKSLELKDLMDNIIGVNNGDFGRLGIIPNFLKKKAQTYLWDNYNPYHIQKDETTKTSTDKIDNFQFEIKVDKKVVSKGMFSGNLFPPKVRYSVDIKEIIPSIINEIRYSLAQKKYTILEANLAV